MRMTTAMSVRSCWLTRVSRTSAFALAFAMRTLSPHTQGPSGPTTYQAMWCLISVGQVSSGDISPDAPLRACL